MFGLEIKEQRNVALWKRHIHSLEELLHLEHYASVAETVCMSERLERTRGKLLAVQSPAYLDYVRGTIGADPLGPYREARSEYGATESSSRRVTMA